MKISLSSNINFKGGAITPYDGNTHCNTFFPDILTAYIKASSGFNKSPNCNNKFTPLNTIKGEKGSQLTLWGDDFDLFDAFLEENEQQIPWNHKDLGLKDDAYVSDFNIKSVKSTKLAKALTEVLNIPVVLKEEKLKAFIQNKDALTRNILNKHILNKALKRIKKITC